jgi:exopolysaccharide biosynthesis polyprenyl glycosylphosphotransferase
MKVFSTRQKRDVLLVGCGSLALETARDLAHDATILGAFSLDGEPARPDLPVPHLGGVETLGAYLATNPVDEVYIATDVRRHHDALQSAIEICERVGIPFAVPAYTFRLGRALPREAAGLADGYVHYVLTISNRWQDAIKRATDIVLSGLALIALSPLFLVVAAAIKLTSSGPVFFKQVRVGLRGRYFPMFKFRSMVVDAERRLAELMSKNEQTGPVFKMRIDPRVTRVGRLLRAYSIDELPQLLNVLRGEMSIVGPRPPVPSEVAQYQPWQRRRLSVRPGLTCLWQVQGRNSIGFDEWMLLDLQYVDQWSFAKDAALIGRTVPVVVSGKGAS